MHMDFETVSTLQYRNSSLTRQVEAFKSGEKYIQMEAEYKKLLCFHHREIKRLEYELSRAHSETVTVRRYWARPWMTFIKNNRHFKDACCRRSNA